MSSRVERLGARILGRAPLLTPRIASRFETPGAASSIVTSGDNDRATPAAPTSTSVTPPREARPRPPRQPVEPAPRFASAPAVDLHAPSAPAEPGSSSAPRILQPPPVAAPQPAIRPSHEVAAVPTPSAPLFEKEPTGLESRTAPPTGDAVPVSQRDLASELRRLRAWMSAPADAASLTPPASFRTETARPADPRPAASPLRDPFFVPVIPPPPAVEITIGTIIVRANTPQSKPAPTAAPVNRAASLAHYLGRRSAGLP